MQKLNLWIDQYRGALVEAEAGSQSFPLTCCGTQVCPGFHFRTKGVYSVCSPSVSKSEASSGLHKWRPYKTWSPSCLFCRPLECFTCAVIGEVNSSSQIPKVITPVPKPKRHGQGFSSVHSHHGGCPAQLCVAVEEARSLRPRLQLFRWMTLGLSLSE